MRYLTIIFCCVLVLFSFHQAQATIICVPAEQPTIQAGINVAVNGDTVLVAPGTYYEHINFNGKEILVKSEAGPENTIIDKLYDGLSIVTFAAGEDTGSVLDGFTIRNASGGSGIECRSASPLIVDNIITNNTAVYPGGGIRCEGSSPVIKHNVISNNSASAGGGLYVHNSSHPIVVNNEIVSNNVTSLGGGVYCYSYCNATITGNIIISNTCGGGGGILCDVSSNGTISFNLICDNVASGRGGGIFCYSNSSPLILNNTITHNAGYGEQAGGIVCQSSCSPTIDNNIVSATLAGYGIHCSGNSTPSISYDDVWNNASGDYYGCAAGEGCISGDPIFCDPENYNYYLHLSSPCLGAGQDGVDIGAFGVGCGVVTLTPGPDEAGAAATDVLVKFYIENIRDLADTFDVSVTDSLGWNIDPLYYEVTLDSNQLDSVSFTIAIPNVPVGTVDRIFATAVSRTDSTVRDSASLTVTCDALAEGVDVTAGSDQSGYADSMVSVAFLVENVGVVPDSYSLDISETQGWKIFPLHYDLVLDTAESQQVSFTVSIPYVPLGTTDELTLLAVSKTNPLARDSASLTVTCNVYVEAWEITSGDDISGSANSLVTAKFYIQNTGLAPDSCSLAVSDSLGWDIQPLSYQLTLDPGSQDSVFFDVFIPSTPVGTTDKITLNGISLTNPFVIDSASLLITCESYNVTITDISDVGNDQGKQVRIYWSSFPGSDPLVTDFTIFRRIDSLLFTSLSVEPKIFFPKDYPPGNWDMIGTYQAFGETLYSAVVPTLKDSTIAEGMYWSVFFIRAGTDNPTLYFDSPIDSGYSLDNLSPSPPTGLLASHEPAVTKLTWTKCGDLDFNYYTLYRDTTSEFEPSSDNRLAFTIDTTFADSTAQLGRTYYYLVSATDFSGNESDPSSQALGVRYITGDANADGEIDIADIVYLINYLFIDGSPPDPLEAGDANCDGVVNIADVIYLVNYLFLGGPPPCEP